MASDRTVVLLTPIALDGRTWDWLTVPAAHVIKHEYPGLGARASEAGAASLAELADEVPAHYDGMLDLVGVSLGGIVAQHVATRHPERVRSLLIGGCGPSNDAGVMNERAAATRQGGLPLAATMQRWFDEADISASPALPGVEYAEEVIRNAPATVVADLWAAMADHDVRTALGAVTAPTTCVAGRDDEAAPPPVVAKLAACVPDAVMVTLPGPHMLQLSQPAAYSAVLAYHLDRSAE